MAILLNIQLTLHKLTFTMLMATNLKKNQNLSKDQKYHQEVFLEGHGRLVAGILFVLV